MYKKISNLNLDNIAISITNDLCDMVQRGPYTGSFNNFEVTIENEIPKIFWETSITESEQPRFISSHSIQSNLETYSIYSSSLNLERTDNFLSQFFNLRSILLIPKLTSKCMMSQSIQKTQLKNVTHVESNFQTK